MTLARFTGLRCAQYRTILADPPWPERGGGKIKRGADRHYSLMSVAAISALPVAQLAHPDGCHLYLWVTNNYLPDGLAVMQAWGFRFVTCLVWAKDRQGLGQYFRGMTELCLFGVRGTLPYKADDHGKRLQGTTLIHAKRKRHSEKPASLIRMAERVSYEPRIELFARERRPDWDAWGNEVISEVALVEVPPPALPACEPGRAHQLKLLGGAT